MFAWPLGVLGTVFALVLLGVMLVNAWMSDKCYTNLCSTSSGIGPEIYAHFNRMIVGCVVITTVVYASATFGMIVSYAMENSGGDCKDIKSIERL